MSWFRLRLPALVLLAAALFAGEPLQTLQPGPEEHIQRVPDRRERIDLVFPAEEGWTQTGHHAENLVETRSFAPAGAEAGFGQATVTVFHDLWNVNLDEARSQFEEQLAGTCPPLEGQLWFEDEANPPRRLLRYGCSESADGAWTVLLLLLQGRDNFYMVELSQGGLLPEGLLVRWAEFLKQVRPCLLDGRYDPCPEGGIWPPGQRWPRPRR
jgi:hypothetical protein